MKIRIDAPTNVLNIARLVLDGLSVLQTAYLSKIFKECSQNSRGEFPLFMSGDRIESTEMQQCLK